MFNLRLYISKKKKKKLIGILILNLVIKGNYVRIDIVGLKKGLVCVWVQIFFYTFVFCISKRWDPRYSSNAFSGMAATFSLNAATFSLEWNYSVGSVHCSWDL